MSSDNPDRGFVVVTGTSTGIGAATALRLARKGFHVFAGVRRTEDGEALLAQAPEGLTPVILDVTDESAIARAAATVADAVGDRGLAGLVNNAGIAKPAPIEFQPMADFRTQLEVNLFGPVAMVQAFLPLIRRGGGRIVNVGSIGGLLVLPLNGAYSASKFGIRAVTDALRLELRQWNIHVSLIEVAPVETAIFGKTYAELDGLEQRLGESGYGLYKDQIAAVRKATEKAAADAGSTHRDREGRTRRAHVGQAEDQVPRRPRRGGGRDRGGAPRPGERQGARPRAQASQAGVARGRLDSRGETVSDETKPSVLIVYFTLTKQVGRVADALAQAFEARGCDVARASLEFTDERWVHHLKEFPMKHPIRQLVTILPAQARHETGEIQVPPEAQSGDYDLVVLASPTWWFQTSMPMRSYLESPGAKAVMSGKPFACASVSRRYFRFNLGQQRTLGEKNGGRWIDQTHFVSAGGQVKSMLAWLGYMKHGEPQARVFGLTMYPPNLKSDFEEQANAFADGLADGVLRRPVAAGAGE